MTTPLTPSRTRIVLIELFVGAFVMGCAEMLVVGMLDLITVDLAVSVPAAVQRVLRPMSAPAAGTRSVSQRIVAGPNT